MCASVSVCVYSLATGKAVFKSGRRRRRRIWHLKATLVWQKHVGDNQDRLTVLCHKKYISCTSQKISQLSLPDTFFSGSS